MKKGLSTWGVIIAFLLAIIVVFTILAMFLKFSSKGGDEIINKANDATKDADLHLSSPKLFIPKKINNVVLFEERFINDFLIKNIEVKNIEVQL